MAQWPRITLVTPSYNQGRYLEAALISVLAQNYPNLEYFVVDGGSTDDSVAILSRYTDCLSWWVSEPDAGQSDAIIKGFSRATGEILNWLNADDLLRPGALQAVARAWRDTSAEVIAGGDRQFRDDPEQPVSHFRPEGYQYPDCLRFWSGRFRYHQPCTFFSHTLYLRVGGLDQDLHYVMDYDLYCRMLADPACRVTYLDKELSAFRLHNAAKTSRAKAAFLTELRQVSQRYWLTAGLEHDERRAMDRYSAECALFQGVEAARRRDWRRLGAACAAAWRYAPDHAASFVLRRLFKAGR